MPWSCSDANNGQIYQWPILFNSIMLQLTTKDYYLLSSVIPKYRVYLIKYWINTFCLIIYPEELKNKMNKNTNIKYKYPTNTCIYLFFRHWQGFAVGGGDEGGEFS